VVEIEISADALVGTLLKLARNECVCLLDSCGVGHLGSHLMIAGIRPVEIHEISYNDVEPTLRFLDEKLSASGLASVFTVSYNFGNKMHGTAGCDRKSEDILESDLFIALFDTLIVHDYDSGRTFLSGNNGNFDLVRNLLSDFFDSRARPKLYFQPPEVVSNFSRAQYISAIEVIKEKIRAGAVYQTNLTQQFRLMLNARQTPEGIFANLRENHPAPFAAYIKRLDSIVVSASPERFFKVSGDISVNGTTNISSSPIKGTRRRGMSTTEDAVMRSELLASAKDRAENTMIVDLTRNDLGRICEFGSVKVEKLCEIEEHPTLFHLVSTVTGQLLKNVSFSEVIRAMFPCGSITGAPKSSTMKTIESIEPSPRGLSMGSIGCRIPDGFSGLDPVFEMNVAIRTMVIRGGEAVFNVGGGVVIDSDPELEYDESLLKARALLEASGATMPPG